jgi:DNA-binding MarR family transcriptional regulator
VQKASSRRERPIDSSTPIEESILRSLRRITRAIDLYSRQLAKQFKLTGPQLVCLRHIRRVGPLMPSELAKAVALSQATITGILDRLFAQGLVSRERSDEDRRRVIVALTSRGIELVESLPSPLQERFANRLAALPEGNQQVIDTILKQIVTMMEADDLEAAPVLQAGSIIDGPNSPS